MNKHLAVIIAIALFPVIAMADITPADVAAKMQAGDVQTAEMFTRQILKEHPNNAKAHYYLGQILATEGKYKDAYAELNKAADLDKTITFAASPERFRQEMDKVKVNLGRAEAPPISDVKDTGWGWFTWLMLFGLGGGAVWFFFVRKPEEKERPKEERPMASPAAASHAECRAQRSYQPQSPTAAPYRPAASAPTQPSSFQAPAAPHVVNNYNSGNDGLVEGMILGSLLSGSHGGGSVTNNTTTIIEKEMTNNTVSANDFDAGNDYSSSSSSFDSGSNDSSSRSSFDPGSSDSFDSGSDSSSFDSGSSSFDSGSSGGGDW